MLCAQLFDECRQLDSAAVQIRFTPSVSPWFMVYLNATLESLNKPWFCFDCLLHRKLALKKPTEANKHFWCNFFLLGRNTRNILCTTYQFGRPPAMARRPEYHSTPAHMFACVSVRILLPSVCDKWPHLENVQCNGRNGCWQKQISIFVALCRLLVMPCTIYLANAA